MRILHVYNQYALFTRGGGVERYIHQLCCRFASRGHAVTVASQVVDAQASVPYCMVVARGVALLREVAAAEVVHIHGPRMRYASLAGLCALLLRKKLIYTMHCFYESKHPWGRALKWLWDHTVERLLLVGADHAVVLSDYWVEYVRARGLPTRRLVVLPNGVDVTALIQEPAEAVSLSGSPAILSVSRLDPVKRVEDVIAALAQPVMQHAQAHIIGRGEDEARLRQWAHTQGVAARVTFHGFQEDAQIAAMARGADVFVIASAAEGMPTTILEMLARRLPVVASEIPGNLSLTRSLAWDYTYPLADIAALAQVVDRAQHATVDDALLARLSATYDWQSISVRMLQLYGAEA